MEVTQKPSNKRVLDRAKMISKVIRSVENEIQVADRDSGLARNVSIYLFPCQMIRQLVLQPGLLGIYSEKELIEFYLSSLENQCLFDEQGGHDIARHLLIYIDELRDLLCQSDAPPTTQAA